MQSGYVESLQIKRKKGFSFEKVFLIQLDAGKGIKGDCHSLGGEKQIALLSSNAKRWVEEQEIKGVCFSRFQENIVIQKMDFLSLTQGVILETEHTKLEIISYTKQCFIECIRVKDKLPCELSTDIRFAKVVRSGIIQIGERIWMENTTQSYVNNDEKC